MVSLPWFPLKTNKPDPMVSPSMVSPDPIVSSSIVSSPFNVVFGGTK